MVKSKGSFIRGANNHLHGVCRGSFYKCGGSERRQKNVVKFEGVFGQIEREFHKGG